MKLPSGKTLFTKNFSQENPEDVLKKALDDKITGYLVLTAEANVMHEGVFFLDSQSIIGLAYESLFSGKEKFGEQAKSLIFNLLKAQKGSYSLVELSKSQLELVTVFNDEIKIKPLTKRDLNKSLPNKYNPILFEGEQIQKKTRLEVLHKLGLLGVDK